MFPFLGPIIEIVGRVLDKVIPDGEARAKAQAEIVAEMTRQDGAVMQAARDTIVAEAQGESWMQRNWRPSLMFVIMGLLIWNGVFLPLLSALTHVDLVKLQAWEAIPAQMWSLLQIGVGGYLVGRSAEKVGALYADAIGKGAKS